MMSLLFNVPVVAANTAQGSGSAGTGMNTTLICIVAIIIGLLLLLYPMYVRLIQLKNKTKEAMSGIDVQLKNVMI